ncbi:hypothetical protein GF377_07005 [candidate division GN15 bacterium]|nr:hypothetical protein [candidate division GN15 bacterium]
MLQLPLTRERTYIVVRRFGSVTSIEAIVNRQILKWELQKQEAEEQQKKRPAPLPIVTISRETGSRGSYFGSRLAQRLGYQRLHREAIDFICRSSGYRRRVVESLDEQVRGKLQVLVDSLLTGQAVDNSDYTRQLTQIVLSMSHLGGVILIGRGGSWILGPNRGFHIRVVCPKPKRIENLQKYKRLDRAEAEKMIDESDRNRRAFIKEVYGADIDNPHHYDLVMNSALIDVEELLDTAIVAMKGKMDKLSNLDHDPQP